MEPRDPRTMPTESRMTRQPPGPLERALAAVLQHGSSRDGLLSRLLRESLSFALSAYAADCEYRYQAVSPAWYHCGGDGD
jgi:hypothetical protein